MEKGHVCIANYLMMLKKIGKLNALVCISSWMDQRYEIFFIKKSPKGFICYHSDKSDV